MATTTTTRYCYDAFGRRIAKSSSVKKSSKLGLKGNVPRFGFVSYEKPQRSTMLILWDGNRQIQELTDKFIFTTVYEQDSFEPVARLIWLQQHLQEQTKINEGKQWQELENYVIPKYQKQRLEYQSQTGIRIYHYHNDHLGTPQELTNSLGEVVWLNYSQAWGGSYETKCFAKELDNLDVSADLLQPIRFQGQFFDGETNLHYNRFRYYDSDVGMFVSRDPIELEGGLNIFSYAPNPIMWIDPFGLAKKKKVRKKTTTSESTEQENCQSPEKVVVYHFTDLKGYNAIRSQSPYLFKASSPEKGHPKGVYVTEWSPERILHKPGGFKSYLGITNEKSEYFFKFKVNKCDLLRIPGGRTHVAYINKDIKISKEDMLDKGVTPK